MGLRVLGPEDQKELLAMRTDVKIGIALGLVLIIGVVIFLVANSGPTKPPADEQPPVANLDNPVGDGVDDPGAGTGGGLDIGPLDLGGGPTDLSGGAGTGGGLTPGIGDGTTSGGTDVGGSTDVSGVGGTDIGPVDVGDGTGGGTDTGGTDITTVPPGPSDSSGTRATWSTGSGALSSGPVDPGTPTMLAYADVDSTSGTGTTDGTGAAATTGTVRPHVIQANDKLWKLAERYYGQGNGPHWQIIAAANPGISPNSLPIGRTIKIPPLPAEATRPIRAPGAGAGTVSAAGTDGRKTYIVAKDDSFWKIAARSDIYGNGIHWKHIAAANPSANSSALHEGDKLVIPPLPVSPSGSPSTGVSAPDPVVRTGEKVYVVKRGDAGGMWGISKAQYGDGKYFAAIAGRNPGANPLRLRIGQKIVLPSLEQAKAFTSGSRGTTTSGGTSTPPVRVGPRPIPAPRPIAGDGEPDFG